jgi:hypothetical protein
MNCFYHPTIVAVGTCKSCGKGLCPECADDLGKGLACKKHCEDQVQGLIRLTDYSIALVDAKKGNLRGGVMTSVGYYLASGALFIIAALCMVGTDSAQWGVALFLFAFGAILLIVGFQTLRRARSLPKQIKTPAPSP